MKPKVVPEISSVRKCNLELCFRAVFPKKYDLRFNLKFEPEKK